MSYDGPGVYQHYKGSLYDVIGIGEIESNGELKVIYVSQSKQHTIERKICGADYILCR